VFALAILWKVPPWQVNKVSGLEPKERFDRINEARKTLAQIIGGIAVLAGFYSTVQNLKVAQTSLALTQENQVLAQRSFALAQQGQITDRFTKAIEQLGAADSSGKKKKLEVRLGGIYALQRIANESEEDRWPIIAVLTTYVRTNAPISKRPPAEAASQQVPRNLKPEADIQAILTVLGTPKVKPEHVKQILNLRDTNLRESDLSGADLRWADLSGADLRGADLSLALLGETILRGANMRGANLSGADLSLALLGGADLRGADLRGALVAAASLTQTDLRGANLTKADLSLAFLTGTNLRGVDLSNAKGLLQEQINVANGDSTTKLPPNLRVLWKANRR
jgi:hypothetical protein